MAKILIQACCGPCAIAAFEQHGDGNDIWLLFNGDNFDSEKEYNKRLEALEEVNKRYSKNPIFIGPYAPKVFEGEMACVECIQHRLDETARVAKEQGFDMFGSSLSVSPHKRTELINHVGNHVGREMDIPFLGMNLKKKGGFQFTVNKTSEWKIYRQDYCGCARSKKNK